MSNPNPSNRQDQPNESGAIQAECEVMAPSALMSLERAAIDSQVATAHQFPRSLAVFKRRALEMATLDEETAESCIYSRPVGEGKVAEGASVRLAEIVAASYGNLRVSSRIVEQTERYVKCEGMAHDLESNYAGKSEVVEPTVTKEGRPYSERQRAVVAKVALAKAYRDAIFKVCPKSLCKSIIDAAKKVAIGDEKTLASRVEKVKGWLKQIKVDESRVFTLLKVKGWPDVGIEQLTTLTGLRTSINDGDASLDEAFPMAVKAPVSRESAPRTFPAGSGEPVAVETKKVSESLILLHKNMSESEVTEVQVLEYGREMGIFDDSLSSLDQVSEMQPDALKVINSSWKSVARKLSK